MNEAASAIFRDDDDITTVRHPAFWDVRTAAPEVFAELARTEPYIAELCERMHDELPIQRRWRFGSFGAFERPDRHVRAIYLKLAAVPGIATAGGAVAIKGAEVLCTNFDKMVERLAGMWNVYTWSIGGITRQIFKDYAVVNAMERFPVIEGKLPGAHQTWDAQEEADAALEIQRAHLRHYGALAKLPVPLFLYQWPESASERVRAAVMPHLSPKAVRIVESGLREGLGGYVYYYPSMPSRVMHLRLPDAGGELNFRQRLDRATEQVGSPFVAIEGWIELVARILAMGYVATDSANLNRGYCLQPHNLCLDGGMVDLNSIRAMSTYQNEGELFMAISRTIQTLAQGVSWLMVGIQAGADEFVERLPDVYACVWSAVRARVHEELSRGRPGHPVLAGLVAPQSTREAVGRMFSLFYDHLQEYRPERTESAAYR